MPIEPCGELLISAGELGYSGSNKSESDLGSYRMLFSASDLMTK